MAIKYERICISSETKEIFMQCKEQILRVHPELKDMQITEDFITRKICRYFLE